MRRWIRSRRSTAREGGAAREGREDGPRDRIAANAMLGRDGHIWGDRYRARVLATSDEVREVLGRVFAGAKETSTQPRTSLLRKAS